MSEELKVNDMDFIAMSNDVKKWLDCQDEAFEQYLRGVKLVYTQGIKEGLASRAFYYLYQEASKIYTGSNNQGNEIKKQIDDFLKRIDETDLNIYG